jgi:hypothetical protein
MGVQPFYGKGPHPLLSPGSRAAREKITISGIPNRLNYCVIFILYHSLQMWPQAAQLQTGGPRVRVRAHAHTQTQIFTLYCNRLTLLDGRWSISGGRGLINYCNCTVPIRFTTAREIS